MNPRHREISRDVDRLTSDLQRGIEVALGVREAAADDDVSADIRCLYGVNRALMKAVVELIPLASLGAHAFEVSADLNDLGAQQSHAMVELLKQLARLDRVPD